MTNTNPPRPSRVMGITRLLVLTFACPGLLPNAGNPALAEDWPTYRHDNRRSGVTQEKIQPPLEHAWIYSAPTPPRPLGRDPPSGTPTPI